MPLPIPPWARAVVLGCACACGLPDPAEVESAPTHPDELPVVVARRGSPADLEDYRRPGIGGAPTALWIAIHATGEVATWAGLDAPWRDPGCAQTCYAVLAPARALSGPAGGPPALLAIHPEAPMGEVVGVLRSLESAGVAAHAVVSADGMPPAASDTRFEVVPLRRGSDPGCGGRFLPDAPFGSAPIEGCDPIRVEVWAPEAPAPRESGAWWGELWSIRDRDCAIRLTRLQMEGVADEVLRPSVMRRLSYRGVHACAVEHGARERHAFTLHVERGVPTRVEAARAAPGAFTACAKDAMAAWRVTADATGVLEVGMEVTCTR